MLIRWLTRPGLHRPGVGARRRRRDEGHSVHDHVERGGDRPRAPTVRTRRSVAGRPRPGGVGPRRPRRDRRNVRGLGSCTAFPTRTADAINRRGAVPLISWEPWDSSRGGAEQPEYALRRIAAGDHDALIDRWAAEAARYRRPVMLRFAPEMNGDWLPWSEGVNGNPRGDYVAAWRHVRARFRRAGADNAIWVWNPIAPYEGSAPLRGLFPGARDVDWVAVDGYNWGDSRPWGWQSYDDVLAPAVRAVRELAPGRPVMIAETGCAPGARKPSWITEDVRGGSCGRRRRAGVVRVRQGDRLASVRERGCRGSCALRAGGRSVAAGW